MAQVYKKVWGSFRENSGNLGKSLRNCKENFKEIYRKMCGSWRKFEEIEKV